MKGYTNEEITEGLSDHGIIEWKRIVRNLKSPQPEQTATLILTLNFAALPDRISIRVGLSERVRMCIPLTRRCFYFLQHGHSCAKCRKALPVCVRSGLNCQLLINCIHCLEPHSVTSKTYSRYLFEKEMFTIKTKEHFTFSEARAKARLTFDAYSHKYAAAVGNSLR